MKMIREQTSENMQFYVIFPTLVILVILTSDIEMAVW
jgi:hypothetical protein